MAEKRFDDAIGLVTHALSEYPGDERLSQAETRCREGKAEHKPTAVAQAVGAAEKTETSQAYGVQIAPPAAQPVASNPFQNLRMDAAGSRTSVNSWVNCESPYISYIMTACSIRYETIRYESAPEVVSFYQKPEYGLG